MISTKKQPKYLPKISDVSAVAVLIVSSCFVSTDEFIHFRDVNQF